MQGFNKEAARALIVTPPRAEASAVKAVTVTGASLDLSTFGTQVQNIANSQSQSVGAFKSYLTVCNDGGTNTLYILSAPTSVLAAALAPAATGTNGATLCYPIFPNTKERFLIEPGIDLFLGYCTSASTTTMRAFVTSDQG